MFTGLVQSTGRVSAIRRFGDDLRLTVQASFEGQCAIGESVCVDGACLTVTQVSERGLTMDVSAETVKRTTLGMLRQGDTVNLERALRINDRLGGHLVTGHVDDRGKILKKERRRQSWWLRIGVSPDCSRYIIEKGSVAVDGISLTVNHSDRRSFEVNIIPLTGLETTILRKPVGAAVNIETDLVGKYIEKLCPKDNPNL